MLQGGMREVDGEKDEFAGQLFDKLLDLAVEDCWKSGEQDGSNPSRSRKASESWYASKFTDFTSDLKQKYQSTEQPKEAGGLLPPHRLSSDTSVDQAIGRVIAGTRFAEFAALSEEERRMLFWNMKNVEYALGANLKDLSMQVCYDSIIHTERFSLHLCASRNAHNSPNLSSVCRFDVKSFGISMSAMPLRGTT